MNFPQKGHTLLPNSHALLILFFINFLTLSDRLQTTNWSVNYHDFTSGTWGKFQTVTGERVSEPLDCLLLVTGTED
jgi:hypothetical protein